MKIVDLHCDTISAIYAKGEPLWSNTCQFDIQRAIHSGVSLQFFALFCMPSDRNTALREILKQIDKFHSEIEKNYEHLYLIKSYNDIKIGTDEKKIGCILHLEGAEALGSDLEVLSLFYRLGLRSMGLTWNNRNLLADGVGEGVNAGGLSQLGKKVIKEMEHLGIILDLAHISEKSFFDALDNYSRPLMVTHANARRLCEHRRNLSDDQLKALAQNNGVVGINQVSDFVKKDNPCISDLLDHVAYIADLIGFEYVALGSDFDGADDMIMTGVQDYCQWEELLSERGFKPQEIKAILQDNALRVIKAVI